MQHKKGFSAGKFAMELRRISDDIEVKYKQGKISAFIPIRKENGYARYKLKLKIDNDGHCDVYIVEPKIKKEDGKNPPHIYLLDSKWDEENQQFDELKLCLYLPGNNEYNKNGTLMSSIISWAIKWTEFYEIWLLTGQWFGGGQHPTTDADKKNKS